MTNPFITVIIPNYNHAQFLDERIQSVLNQTYPNYEVIILDDKSTDNSFEIINKYKENPHIAQIIVNEENSGSPFKQWRKGIELAKGEYIWIAESDDSCDKDFLSVLVNAIIQDNTAVVAFCQSRRMDEDGQLHQVLQPRELPEDNDGISFINNYLLKKNVIINVSSAIFKRQDALLIDEFYTTFSGAGDTMFWIEMSERGRVVIVNKALNYYRIHSKGTTIKQLSNGMFDIERKRIYDYCVQKGHVSFLQSFLFRKLYIYEIVYGDEYYKDSVTREKALKVWQPSVFIRFLSYLSAKHNKKSSKI